MKLITRIQKYLIGVLLIELLVFTSFVSLSTPAYAGSPNVREVTDQNFESEVLKSDLPVLVAFYATWSGSSRNLDDVLSAFADEYQNKAKVYKLDIESSEIAFKYGFKTLPTYHLFKKGSDVASISGLIPITRLVQFFEAN